MIKDKIKVNKTMAIISVIIAGGLLCTGVLASGIFSYRYTKKLIPKKKTQMPLYQMQPTQTMRLLSNQSRIQKKQKKPSLSDPATVQR